MLTAKDIRDVTFEKIFGGYRVTEVDDFLDLCIETVEQMTAENQELTRKLEMLADKLLEYRGQEDSIHSAFVSAQRSGESVIREANHKAELILRDAQIKGEGIIETARTRARAEQEELERLQQEVSNFRKRLMAIYQQHIELISELPAVEEPEEPEEPEEETPVLTISEVIGDISSGVPEAAPVVPIVEEVPEESTEEPAAETPEVPRRKKSRFSDLRFGEDYDISSDEE